MDEVHLTSAEISVLLPGAPAAGDELTRPLEALRRHLDQCAACAANFAVHRTLQEELQNLPMNHDAKAAEDCPPEQTWTLLSAGLLAADEADRALAHAASCGVCAGLLRAAVDCLDPAPTAQESEFLDRLPRRTVMPMRSRPSRLWAIAAGLTAAAGLSWWWFYARATAPLDLLAAASSESRTLELRIPGARYAPLTSQRAASAPPPSLLQAEAILSRDFNRHGADPAWLHAQGRAELLAGRYDAAVKALARAAAMAPDRSEVLTDLASTLIQRAVASGNPADFVDAQTTLDRVISTHPENLPALFNRALLHELRGQNDLALRDWTRYLQLDSTGGWADEARQHQLRLSGH